MKDKLIFQLNILDANDPKAHVIAWINACADGGVPWQGSAEDLKALSDAVNDNDLPANEIVGADHYWIIRNTRGWEKKFYSVLCPPGDDGVVGTKAWKELRTPSRHHELRLLQVGSGITVQYLATFLTQEGVYFLCPKTGLFYWSVEQSRAQFKAHMEKNYSANGMDEFRAWIVPLPTLVHITWIGPASPSTAGNPASSKPKDLRKDIAAAQRLSKALRHHLIFFHCLSKYKGAFVNLFPAAVYPNVRVMAIEDQLAEAGDTKLRLVLPDSNSLDRSVGYVFRQSIKMQRDGPKRDFVNAKNLWSLYTIWRYGGYHLDSGVFPHGNSTSLPEPDDFGLARNLRQSGSGHGQTNHSSAGKSLRLVQLAATAPGPTQFNAVLTDLSNVFQEFVFPPRKGFKNQIQPRFAADLVVTGEVSVMVFPNTHVDVWLMGSNPMNPVPMRAMWFYIQQWFLLQKLRETKIINDRRYNEACRVAIMSAVYTGMAPVDEKEFWGGPRNFFDHFGYGFKDRIVEEFGLMKVFYGTHRTG